MTTQDNSNSDSKLNSVAHETYNIHYWSEGFFDIDNQGYITLGDRLAGFLKGAVGADKKIRLKDIVDSCTKHKQKLDLPLLIRFPDIIKSRLDEFRQAFADAFDSQGYQGEYLPAYPIKVNQQQSVVNSFVQNHEPNNNRIALEAGSKPELFITIAMAAKYNLDVICNGYKDRDFIKLALLGQKLGYKQGFNVNIIVEKLSELDIILQESENLNIMPRIGVRVRLASLGKGNWQNTGGVKSKFGLTSLQLITFLDKLKQANKLDCLKLLHFHMGSQISALEDIQNGLTEGVRLYAEICRAGANLEALDVGGGLGVDYEGTCSRSYYSINYNIKAYANAVVKAIKIVCDQEKLPHPKIITESGRAMVAHHAVLVTDIIDAESVVPEELDPELLKNNTNNLYVSELKECLNILNNNSRAAMEVYYQAKRNHDLAQQEYIVGNIHLPLRAQIEQLYYKVCVKLISVLDPKIRIHSQLLDTLNEEMADKIFTNFSLFQSLPDIWGLEQIFPVLPLNKLEDLDDRSKSTRGLIQDMTCDSDGRIDKYIDGQGVESSLPLPKFEHSNPYYIGFFMVGAYQEILGDMHNLFGDTATVDVILSEKGFEVTNTKSGDLIIDVLKHVGFDAKDLVNILVEKYNNLEQDSNKQENLLNFLKDYINKSPYWNG